MKKAVIVSGGKQYLVAEGQIIQVELVGTDDTSVEFIPLMVIDGSDVLVGTPELSKSKVVAEVIAADQQADKVTSIRYKAKKRVHTVRGHRQHQTHLKITKIA
jgi:large subunit ribosomal protein L21